MADRDHNRSNDSGTGAKALDRGSMDEQQREQSGISGSEGAKGGDERSVDDQAISGDREPTANVKAAYRADEPERAKVNGSNVSD